MQLPILCGIAAFLPWCESSREPQGHGWQAAKTGDSRSPCPMLNSLANHGYLPRDGHNIDAQTATSVLTDALNFDPAPFVGQIQGVMKVSTTGKNGTFNLVDLNQKPFEHDASLSRNEAFSGDSLHFDPKVWAQTFSHFRGKDIITIQMAAEARADRVATAMKTNPEFNLTEAQVSTTYAESGLYLMAFGDKTNGNARTDWVRSFFEHERLPFNQGWNKPRETVSLADVQAMAQKVAAVPVGK